MAEPQTLLTDESANQLLADTKPVNTPYNPLSDESANDLLAEPKQEESRNIFSPVTDVMKYTGAQYNMGNEELHQAALGARVLQGKISYKEAREQSSPEAIAQFKAKEIDPIESHAPWVLKVFGTAVRSIPSLGQQIKGMAYGAAVGGGTGAAIGLVGGPAAELTVPSGFFAGALAGGNAGAAGMAASIAQGGAYMQLREAGIPDDIAKKAAVSIGLTSGVAASVGFGTAAKPAQEALLQQAESEIGKKALNQFVKENLKDAGLFGYISTTQNIAQNVISNMAATKANIKNATKPFSEIVKEAADAFALGAVTGSVVHAGTSVAAKAVTNAFERMFKEKEFEFHEVNNAHNDYMNGKVSSLPVSGEVRGADKAELQYDAMLQNATEEHNRYVEAVKQSGAKRLQLNARIEKTEEKIEGVRRDLKVWREKYKNMDKKAATSRVVSRTKGNIEHGMERVRELEKDISDLKSEHTSVTTTLEGWVEALKESRKELDRLQKLEDKAKAKARENLTNLVNSTGAKGKKSQFSFTEGDDRQTVLDMFRLATKKGGLKKLSDAVTNPDVVVPEHLVHMANEVATRVGDLESATSSRIKDLADQIEKIKNKGLQERFKEIAEQKAEIDAVVQKLEGAVNLTRTGQTLKSEIHEPLAQTVGKQGAINNVGRYFTGYGNLSFDWDGLVRMVTQFAPKDVRNELANALDASKIMRGIREDARKQLEQLGGRIEKHTGMKRGEVIQFAADLAHTPFVDEAGNAPTYITRTGGVDQLENLTRGQALYLYGQMKRDIAKDGFKKGNEFTYKEDVPMGPELEGSAELLTTEGMFERLLTDKEKNFLKGVAEFYQKDNAPRLQNAYRRATGKQLQLDKNYMGRLFRSLEDDEKFDQDKFMQSVGLAPQFKSKRTVALPGFAKEVTENSKAIVPVDIFQNTLRQIQQTERFYGWVDKAPLFNAAFNNQKTRYGIKVNTGTWTNEVIEKFLDQAINGVNPESNKMFKIFAAMQARIANTALALNYVRKVKHWVGMSNYAIARLPDGSLLGNVDLAKGVTYYYTHRKEMQGILEETGLLKSRYDNFGDTLSTEISKGPALAASRKFQELGLSPLKEGDKAAVLAGGTAVYRKVLELTGDHEQAVQAFEKATNEVQYSNNIESMSDLGRERSLKWLTMFSELPERLNQREVEYWRNASNDFVGYLSGTRTKNEAAKSLWEAMTVSGSVRMSQGLFVLVDYAYLNAMPFYKKEEREEALWRVVENLITGPLTERTDTFIHPLITEANNLFNPEGKKRVYEVGNGLFDGYTHLQRLLTRSINATNDNSWNDQKVLDNMIDFAHVVGAPDAPLKLLKHAILSEGN